MKYIIPALFALLLLSSCSLVPDCKKPDMATPAWRSAVTPAEAALQADWWTGFGNPEMPELVNEALTSNNDVRAAVHRIEQARAAAQVAGSSLWPTLDAAGNIGRSQNNPSHGATTTTKSYSAGLQAGYELDLFGRNRAEADAAEADAKGVEFDKEALALVTMSDTAQAFIGLLSLQDRIVVAQSNLANGRDVLKITQARFDAGTLSAIELAQQKTAQANTEASVAQLAQQREAQLDALAVLVGKMPQDFTVKSTTLIGFTLPAVAVLQPAQLLERRPDIRSSEAQLEAANYDIGAARAAFFPSFQLSASASVGATPISAPVALANAVAASFTAPIFEGGALEGNLALTKARRAELEEQYKKVVLTAFQEVQDSLAAQQGADERVKQYSLAVEQAQTAYDLVRKRFDAGTIDFTTLLDTQSSLFSAQDALISAKQAQFAAAIILYKALGGSWQG